MVCQGWLLLKSKKKKNVSPQDEAYRVHKAVSALNSQLKKKNWSDVLGLCMSSQIQGGKKKSTTSMS